MNAVTCACGSSPAYVYTFIEALADSVVSLGIPRDKAYLLVAQTVMGAASMVLASNEHRCIKGSGVFTCWYHYCCYKGIRGEWL